MVDAWHDGWWMMMVDGKRCSIPFTSEIFWWGYDVFVRRCLVMRSGLTEPDLQDSFWIGLAEIVPVVLLVRPNTGGSISCMISHCVTSHFTSLSLWYTVLTCCIWQVYSIESLYNGGVSKMGSLTIHRVFYRPFCDLTQQRPVCRVRSWPIGLTGKGSYSISIARMRSMRRSFSLSKSCVCTLNVLHVCLTLFDYVFSLLHVITWYIAD